MQTFVHPRLSRYVRLLSLVLLTGVLPVARAWADTGIFEGYVVLGFSGGSTTYYRLNPQTTGPNIPFNGTNLGTFATLTNGGVLNFSGGQIKTYKNGTCNSGNTGNNVLNGTISYTVYPTSARPASPTFTQVNLPFETNLANPGDQQWTNQSNTANVLSGLTAGNYTIEVYTQSDYNGCNLGTNYFSNGGSNYRATFSVSSLCGTVYTIDNTIPASATNYTSFTSAFQALNSFGVTCATTFVVKDGTTYTETLPVLGVISGASSTNTVTFVRSNTTSTKPIIAAPANSGTGVLDGIVRLSGTDFVTFDGVDVSDANNTAASATQQMEFGYVLHRASATDGCQSNAIRNCAVALNKANPATIGIWGANSTSAAPGTALTTTSTAGGNSNNKLNGNSITNSQLGIYFQAGSATSAANYDSGNEIGTTAGNTLTNIGAGTGSVYGIRGEYQANLKIENNSITIPTGSTGTIRGIAVGVAAGTSLTGSLTINNNTVVINSATTSTVWGIDEEASTALTSLVFTNNKVQNGTLTGTSGSVNYIQVATTGIAISLTANQVSGNTAATSGTVSAIYRTGASSAATTVSSNTVQNNTVSGAAATFYGIRIPDQSAGTTVVTANSNTISGNQLTGSSGTLFCAALGTAAVTFNSNTVTNNTIPTSSSSGSASIIYGYYNLGSPGSETLTSNTITGLSINGTGAATGHLVRGIYVNTITGDVQQFSQNTIGGLSLAGSGSGVVSGISLVTGGAAGSSISRNKLYDLSAAGAASSVIGINITGGGTYPIINNIIGGLTAPAATGSNAIIGINLTGNTLTNLYYNTIYLNATGGTGFTSAGVYMGVTTANSIELRNNIIINNSTSTAAGGTAVLRRNGTNATNSNITANTNNNLYYAGTPGVNNVIFTDGTLTYQTLPLYKAAVSPKESNSFTENTTFESTTGTDARYLHLSPTVATQAESGGLAFGTTPAGLNVDYDGDARLTGAGQVTDIGADEGNYTAADLTGPVITYTALANTASTASRTLTATITDPSGIGTLTNAPRIYYRKGTTGAYIPAVATSATGSSYTFTIDYTLLGSVTGGDVINYYVAAQDQASTPNLSTSPGGGSGINPPGTTAPGSPNTYTITPIITGPLTVGTGQTYTSLTGTTGLFNYLNGVVLSGNVVVNVTSDLVESGAVALNEFASGATLTIQSSTTTERLISGALAASGTASLNGLIRLNGADNVTFSGGSANSNLASATRYLRFRNTGTAPVFLLLNGATTNTISNATVEGGSVAASAGTITLDGSTANSTNTIAYCDLRDRSDASSTVPLNAIYASGTNQSGTIKGNTIRNFSGSGIFGTSTASGNGWTIGGSVATDGNRIYQEAARAGYYGVQLQAGNSHTVRYNSVYQVSGNVTGAFVGVYLTGGGTGHVVSNNMVGGAAADGTGTLTTTAGFNGIWLPSVGTAVATAALVQGNTVRNITSTNTGTTTNYGIRVATTGGAATIGGASAALGNTVSNITTAFDVYAIYASSAPLAVQYNTVSNVQYNSGATDAFLRGIYCNSAATATTVSNNTISTVARVGTTIRADAKGIVLLGAATYTVDANTVTGLSLGSGNNGTIYGISAEAIGTYTVTNNNISGISSGSAGNGTSLASTTVGLGLEDGSPTASGNTISDISNTNTTAAGTSTYTQVAGIDIYAPGAVVATRNRVSNVRIAAQAGSSTSYYDGVQGIIMGDNPTSALLANNQVSLATSTTSAYVMGIIDISSGTANRVYFNTVYLAGASTGTSYGFLQGDANTVTLRNNVLVNQRTGGAHYAIRSSGSGSFSSNYNNLYASTAARTAQAGTTDKTFAAWQASAGTPDLNSKNVNVKFVNATAGDLTPDASTNCQLDGTGISLAAATPPVTDDFSQTTRSNPPDLGSKEFTVVPNGASFASTMPLCGAGTLNVTIAGSNGPFIINYSIGGVAQTAITGATTGQAVAIPAQATTASVVLTRVTDAYGCDLTLSSTSVTANALPTANAGTAPANVCAGYTYSTTGSFGGSATSATYTSSGTGTFSNGGVINSSTPGVTYSPSAADIAAGSVTLTLTTSGPCAPVTSTLALTINTSSTWTGAANYEWNNPGNWDNCVPNLQVSATVPAGTPNSISDGEYFQTQPFTAPAVRLAEAKNLTVAAGAFMEFYAHDLNLAGDLVNNGDMYLFVRGDFTAGTNLQFVGSAAQTATRLPEKLYTLTVNKPLNNVTVLSTAVSNGPGRSTGTDFQTFGKLTMTSGLLNLGTTVQASLADYGEAAVLPGFGTGPALAETNTSYIVGRVRVLDYADETYAANFGGLGLTVTPATGSIAPGDIEAFRTTGTALSGAGTSQSVQRWFRLLPTTDSGLNATLRMDLFDHERNGIPNANLQLFSSPIPTNGGAPAGPWTPYRASALVAASTPSYATAVQVSGLTHLSDWTLGSSANPLPVELTKFEAVRLGQNARLDWSTASEKNNAGFEVQVSTDGRAFRKLQFVEPASARSASTHSYTYTDLEPGKAGLRYYRLRQLDLDGTESFSPVRSLDFGQVEGASLTALPNPFSSQLLVLVHTRTATDATLLTVTDATGRTVLSQRLTLPAGHSQVSLDNLDHLPAGIYLLHLPLDGQQQHVKLVKK